MLKCLGLEEGTGAMGAWEHGSMAWARESTKEVWFVLGTSWRERRERGLSDSDLAERPNDGTLSLTAHSSQRGLTWLAQAQAQAQALARADRGRYVSGTMRRPDGHLGLAGMAGPVFGPTR